MASDDQNRKQYEAELKGLVEEQQSELKKKTNPLFAKMHSLSEDEVEELRQELLKAHEKQRQELAEKFGLKP